VEIVTNKFEFLENGLGLSLVVFFPLVSALIVALMPKKARGIDKVDGAWFFNNNFHP